MKQIYEKLHKFDWPFYTENLSLCFLKAEYLCLDTRYAINYYDSLNYDLTSVMNSKAT